LFLLVLIRLSFYDIYATRDKNC
uniref:Uncharacterized protein n=1 Tax=Amphimedon queenslandica TaxID=400682 RepID=A0A1X7SM93_AMPQE